MFTSVNLIKHLTRYSNLKCQRQVTPMSSQKIRSRYGINDTLKVSFDREIRYESDIQSIRSYTTQRIWQWRHNERDGVLNHRRLDGFLNRLSRRRSKKTSKLLASLVFVRGIPLTKDQ